MTRPHAPSFIFRKISSGGVSEGDGGQKAPLHRPPPAMPSTPARGPHGRTPEPRR